MKKINHHPLEFKYIIAWLYPLNLLHYIRPKSYKFKIISILLRQKIKQINVSDYLFQKKQALLEYQSQIKLISKNQKYPVLKPNFINSFFSDNESFFIS